MFSNENSLERFLLIDDEAYKIALSEIKNGKKTSHWATYHKAGRIAQERPF